MKKLPTCFFLFFFVSIYLPHPASARERTSPSEFNLYAEPWFTAHDQEKGLQNLLSSSQIDTFVLGDFDFESLTGCSLEGWTVRDMTAQLHPYWHVTSDSFATCLPSNAMWCGQELSAEVEHCSWVDPPGYGNDWEQYLGTKPFSFSGKIDWTFRIAWDTEAGYDFVRLQYDSLGVWVDRLVLDGQSGGSGSCYEEMALEITPIGLSKTKLRFAFTSDTGFSDADGLDRSTWGAVSVDNIAVTDKNGAIVPFEDFEDETAGVRGIGELVATEGGDTTWYGYEGDAVGNYVGVDIGLFEEDPCRDNFTCQVYFTFNSTLTDPNYPGVFVTPHELKNELVSPVLDWDQGGTIPATASKVIYHLEVYRDLPLAGAVVYSWGVRTFTTSSPACPGQWKNDGLYYWGPEKDFIVGNIDMSDHIELSPDAIQVRFEVADLCEVICQLFGLPGTPHSPAPYLDNVRIYRLFQIGPSWSLETFLDGFPEDGSLTGVGRIDKNTGTDAITVRCGAPSEGGLASPPKAYVRVSSGPHSGLTGFGMEGSWGTVTSVVGEWTCIEMDTAVTGGLPDPGNWHLDLNDSLFVPGDVIEYFFSAQTNLGNAGTNPPDTAGGSFYEVSILPTPGREILFVTSSVNSGARLYFTSAFEQAGYGDKCDEYNAFFTGESPGNRIKALSQIQAYNTIVWDFFAIPGNDAAMLRDFLAFTPHDVGVWITRHDILGALEGSSDPTVQDLLQTWCGVLLAHESHVELTGFTTPVITARPGSPWYGANPCSSVVAFGGCPWVVNFDILETTGGSKYSFVWPGHNPSGGDPRGAVITNEKLNNAGSVARTIWQGSYFPFTVNPASDVLGSPLARTCFLEKALIFFSNPPGLPTDSRFTPIAYELGQSVPNPFNPSSRIDYALPAPGHMTLIVYDAAGRRVRTLFDGHAPAGFGSVTWDGRNDADHEVASGVYFYRLTTEGYTDEKKMVLLK